jgi:hypothetical protein
VGFVAVAAATLALASAAAPASNLYPIFDVISDAHLLGEADDVGLDAYNLDASGTTGKLVITTPAGFSASVVQAADTNLGTAQLGVVKTAGGTVTTWQGTLLAMDAPSYAADTGAQACDPGSHTAAWRLSLAGNANGNVSIPVAVDSAGRGYKLTMCFGAVQSLGLTVSTVYLGTKSIFRNPVKHGQFLFDGTVTPFASDGSLNSSSAYELRGYEYLPQDLTISPSYSTTAKKLTVTGSVTADNRPRAGINVHFYGAATSTATTFADLGFTDTADDGTFTFTKPLTSLRYPYLYAQVNHYVYQTCKGATAAPGGCATYSIDGRSSYLTRVVVDPITTRTSSPQLTALLLTATNLSHLKGAPAAAFVNEPIAGAGLSGSPEEQAPCGAKIKVPSLQTGAISFLVSKTGIGIVEWANELNPATVAAFIRAQTADTRSGCTFSATKGAVSTTTTVLQIVKGLSITDPYTAVVIRSAIKGAGIAYDAEIWIERGSLLQMVQVYSGKRPSTTFIENVAVAADKRLDSSKL